MHGVSPRSAAWAASAAALGSGVLVTLALPPWGWWPLAFLGFALLDRLLAGQPTGARFRRGWLFGLGWLAPGMGWMWFLTAPGYLIASVAYSAYIGAACALSPPSRWRRVAIPAAITLAELIRFAFPFGGVPLASVAIGQAAGPLAPVARLGGAALLTGLTIATGFGLSALAARQWRPAAISGAVVSGALVLAAVAPAGRTVGALTVDGVQGGGPQGTRAVDGGRAEARRVFERHLAATELVELPVDLIVWPENVVNVDATAANPDGTFAGSPEADELAALARRLGTPISPGIVEDGPEPRTFLNFQAVIDAGGEVVARYDKVRRVPFGEWMPFRGLLTALGAPTDLVPNDAIAGRGPAVLDSPVGRLGVVISWEVFFGGRARDAAGNGGLVVLNPTNGSSYTGTILQSQQIASSRLRALETGRWVVQVAPTGFSAFVTPDGRVLDRTALREPRVIQRRIDLRAGETIYVRTGDRPVFLTAAALVALAWALHRRDARLTAPSGRSPARR